jgi:hypothetical protein
LAFDAVIYQATPDETEKESVDLSITAIFVVNFDHLRMKKIRHVSAFTQMNPIERHDWTSVARHIAPAIRRAIGDGCITSLSMQDRPFDIKLLLSIQSVDAAIQSLTVAMAAHKLTLKRVDKA